MIDDEAGKRPNTVRVFRPREIVLLFAALVFFELMRGHSLTNSYFDSAVADIGEALTRATTLDITARAGRDKRKDKIAIVYKVKTIAPDQTCQCERFLALLEGTAPSLHHDNPYTIILLHEPDETVSPSLVQWIEQSRHADRVMVLSNPAPVESDEEYFRDGRASKLYYLKWATQFRKTHDFNHYWLVEEDVFWTGQWGHFFEINDRILGIDKETAPDYVCKQHNPIKDDWEHSWSCGVNGTICWDEETNRIHRAQNTLFRISDRFLQYLDELFSHDGVLTGLDEAYLPAALKYWQTHKNRTEQDHWLHHQQLFQNETKEFDGYNKMGAWSVWRYDVPKHKPVYSLLALASMYHHNSDPYNIKKTKKTAKRAAKRGLNATANMKVPHNKIFHPVKCDADASMGPAALAFALGELSGDPMHSETVTSLSSVCSSFT